MAQAFKCDICNNLYEYYDGIQVNVNGGKYRFNSIVLRHDSLYEANKGFLKTYDLCPSCCAKVDDLIRNGSEKIERQEV